MYHKEAESGYDIKDLPFEEEPTEWPREKNEEKEAQWEKNEPIKEEPKEEEKSVHK